MIKKKKKKSKNADSNGKQQIFKQKKKVHQAFWIGACVRL